MCKIHVCQLTHMKIKSDQDVCGLQTFHIKEIKFLCVQPPHIKESLIIPMTFVNNDM